MEAEQTTNKTNGAHLARKRPEALQNMQDVAAAAAGRR